MTAEKFWLGWLKTTTYIIILTGILLITLYNLGFTAFIDAKIDKAFFNEANPGMAIQKLRIWMISVGGATMTGWGLAMLYIVNHPFQRREKWAWGSLFYPIICWYLLDTGISIRYGVGINVIINTILFFQVIAPLLFFRNKFYSNLEPAL